jgi:chorismate synthase
MRVAAGGVARKVLDHLLDQPLAIRGALIQIADLVIDRERWDWDEVGRNPFFSPDPGIVESWADLLDRTRKSGSSAGAVIEVVASGMPAGLGEPAYDKLDADLAKAMMSINAVKGVEIGAGFGAAVLRGEDNADEMRMEGDRVVFLSNSAGGVLGGISTGQDLVARFAVKPTSSILTPRKTVNMSGENTEISTKGRHDPCVGIRAVPVGEAMMAVVLADHLLRHRAQVGL